MHPRLTIHASPAASSTTISSAVRPDGNASVIVRSHEGRCARCSLLIERLAFGAVDVSLEDKGTVADSGERARCDRQVVANQIELRELGLLREVQLVRIANADLVSIDREQLGSVFFRHKLSLQTIRAM